MPTSRTPAPLVRRAGGLLLVVAAAASGCNGPASRHGAVGPRRAPAAAAASELDVVAENARPGSRDWRIPPGQEGTADDVAGYFDRPTAVAGEALRLHVSARSATTMAATAYRVGYYGGTGAREYWHSGALRVHHQTGQTVVAATRTVSEDWPVTTTVATRGWTPGCYLVKLTAALPGGTRSRYVPLVVRSTSTTGRTVLMPSVLTSNAYNTFGGRSAYTGPRGFADRAYAVSFVRPNTWKSSGLGTGKFLTYEKPVVQLAEQLGLPLAYESDLDLSTVPGVLRGARALVALGHAEYWTLPERDAVERARDAGTNLVFLGANTSYWRVRLADHDHVMVVYKSTADPAYPSASTTTLWRAAPHPRPEWLLTGLTYDCFPARGALTVTEPSFWGFRGTGARRGSAYAGLIGPEVDQAVAAPGVPHPLEVVASSDPGCGGRASMAYWTARSGAGVVSTGTMGWVPKGFSSGVPATSRAFVRTVTTTLLQEASRGPLGTAHPARATSLR